MNAAFSIDCPLGHAKAGWFCFREGGPDKPAFCDERRKASAPEGSVKP